MSPEVRINTAEISNALEVDVIKRDVMEGEKAEAARKQVARAAGRTLRTTRATEAAAPLTTDFPAPDEPPPTQRG